MANTQNEQDVKIVGVAPQQVWWENKWLLNGVGAFVIIALTVAVYWHAFTGGFIWDDNIMVSDNPFNRMKDGWLRLWSAPPSDKSPDYFPLTYMMFWVQYQLFEPGTATMIAGSKINGYHTVNIILHIVDCLLLWSVLRQIKLPVAWLIATLFAIYPVNVPSVAWVAELKNTMVMMFYLGTIYTFLKFEDTKKWGWYVAAIVLFILGCLSKSTIVVLPPVLLLLAWWRYNKVTLDDVMHSLPFWGLGMVCGVVTMWYQYRGNGGMPATTEFLPIGLFLVGKSTWYYIIHDLWPLNCSTVLPVDWNPINGAKVDIRDPFTYLPTVMVGVVFVLLALLTWWKVTAKWARAVFFAYTYFLITMSLMLGIFPTLYLQFSPVADHWQYLSVMAWIALPVCAIAKFAQSWTVGGSGNGKKKKKNIPDAEAGFLQYFVFSRPLIPIAAGAAAVAMIGLCIISYKYVIVYSKSENVWLDVIDHNPTAWVAYNNYGRDIANGPEGWKKAIPYFQKAVELNNTYADALHNLGTGYYLQGECEKSADAYRRALQVKNRPESWTQLGMVYRKMKNLSEAMNCFQQALNLDQGYMMARFQQASMLEEAGNIPDAVAQYRVYLQYVSNDVMACNNLAWILATSPTTALRNPQDAVVLAERAVKLTEKTGGEPRILDTLAAAYASAGKFDLAVKTGKLAAQRAVQCKFHPRFVSMIEARTKAYEAGKCIVSADAGQRLPEAP